LPLPIGQRHLDCLAQNADAGVGDHHVQTPEAPLGGFDYSQPAFLERDVLMLENRLAAGTFDLVRDGQPAGIVNVGHPDLGALARQCTAQAAPIPDASPLRSQPCLPLGP
jgi:hypothetical protein